MSTPKTSKISPYVSPATILEVIRNLLTDAYAIAYKLDVRVEERGDKLTVLELTDTHQELDDGPVAYIAAAKALCTRWGMNIAEIREAWLNDWYADPTVDSATKARIRDSHATKAGKEDKPENILPQGGTIQ